MRVLVSGSRDFSNTRLLGQSLNKALKGRQDITIVHGGARGADSIAGDYAKFWNYPEEVYKPDWNKYGKAAGVLRNKDMLDTGVDLVVAFPVGRSPGTRNMIKIAQEAGVETVVIEQ